MPNQIERFTERARRVMTLAQEEATNLRHPKIEPEHLLLAMLRDGVSIGGRVLIELGLGYNQLQTIIGNIQVESFTDTPLDLSDETKRLLENAIDQSRRMGHPQVGTEHLLLGLAHGKNRAVEILAELGVSPEEIRRYTQRVREEPRTNPSANMPESLINLYQYRSQINEVLSEMGVDAEDFWKRLEANLKR
jgi:ATP-dependent Clp protease ATP-binding subunit ClpC